MRNIGQLNGAEPQPLTSELRPGTRLRCARPDLTIDGKGGLIPSNSGILNIYLGRTIPRTSLIAESTAQTMV
jgi:hypothetical protein